MNASLESDRSHSCTPAWDVVQILDNIKSTGIKNATITVPR